MHKQTGEIKQFSSDAEAIRYGFVPIKRDLTLKEIADKKIRLYALCGCGSGKKFKFCCHTKELT